MVVTAARDFWVGVFGVVMAVELVFLVVVFLVLDVRCVPRVFFPRCSLGFLLTVRV